MNKIRRAKLSRILETLEELQAELAEIAEEEEEYRDNIPENMQGSKRYEKADAACDSLAYADDSLSELVDYITEAMG